MGNIEHQRGGPLTFTVAKTCFIDLAVSLQFSVGHHHFRGNRGPSPGLAGLPLHEHRGIRKQVQSWSEYYV